MISHYATIFVAVLTGCNGLWYNFFVVMSVWQAWNDFFVAHQNLIIIYHLGTNSVWQIWWICFFAVSEFNNNISSYNASRVLSMVGVFDLYYHLIIIFHLGTYLAWQACLSRLSLHLKYILSWDVSSVTSIEWIFRYASWFNKHGVDISFSIIV